MDDNPWGNPSPSPQQTPPPDLPPASPSLSINTEDSAEPDWQAPQDQDGQEPTTTVTDQHLVSPPIDDHNQDEDDTGQVNEQETVKQELDEVNEQEDEAPAPTQADDKDQGLSDNDEAAPAPKSDAPSSPPKPTTLSMTLPPLDDGPPMDSFSDDEEVDQQPSTEAAAVGDSFDDDFDDFGEAGAGDGDDDFGDFGDFDAGDMGSGDDAFAGAGSFVEEEMAPPPPQPQPPVASTSRSGYPPLQLDLSNTSKAAIGEQLKGFLDGVYPGAAEAVSDEPERQVEGAAQVLVNEPLRGLLSTLSSLPPLRPLDWRRSRIRREHLIALGVPVNLDDSADSKPLASLVLPSQINTLNNSPSIRSASPSGPRSSTPPGAPYSPSSAYPPSRSGTPFADRERQRASALPPPLDRKRADTVCAIGADDLVLLSVSKLRELRDEIEALSNEASGVLTHALLMREKEVGDAETYNGMIQDLVMAAAKAKTTSGRGSATPTRSSSGRWGRNPVK
ncbi:hypothetical protein BCR35DRAFT_323522 [Leucosporidium creatinivorum]|uniref:Uncharacterized protein n=1 Tax=Leucosporidium creatinivorum TaxID=106004 RepID=A0A1Y2G1H1_9BASI|nr:hypothetical protein BCR35DRAFT_323522 [Leucosporidium creatinivorum]